MATPDIIAPPVPVGEAPGHGAATMNPAAFKFDRMFPDLKDAAQGAAALRKFEALVELGTVMDVPPPAGQQDDSDIPSGYTYLGQLLAHEISNDGKMQEILKEETDPANVPQCCSPTLDLDSLYGKLPEVERDRMYEADGVRMKVDKTADSSPHWAITPPFDLPRALVDGKPVPQAQIGDSRNDENLPVAQTHVAFTVFHNSVADWLDAEKAKKHLDRATFAEVREEVIRHFQWIVLRDYLPRVVDEAVLEQVLSRMRSNGGQSPTFSPRGGRLYMPVEFSVGAFRFGHSMVRRSYEWNFLHKSGNGFPGAAPLAELFQQTALSGDLGGAKNLKSEWLIDWKRFYDFSGYTYPKTPPRPNMAKRIDTAFDFRLMDVRGFRHPPSAAVEHHPLPVRNLLRGFALRLPSGQQVAERLGVDERLSPEQIAEGPHEEVLKKHGFQEETPLLYYVLKEAEMLRDGQSLGPVGSRLVAETFVGIIRNSEFTILDATDETKDWRPKLGERAPEAFDMTDMLRFSKLDAVIPLS
jgi:hypothetical protein